MRQGSVFAVLTMLAACTSNQSNHGEPVGRTSQRLVMNVGAMTMERQNAPCSVAGTGEVLIAGSDIPGGYLSTAEVFDTTKRTWTEVTALPAFRGQHAAVTLDDGKVLVHGGYGSDPVDGNIAVSTGEIFNPSKRTWSPAAASKTARAIHALTRRKDGTILATGGYVGYYNTATSDAELYDPVKNTWSAVPAMAYRRVRHVAVPLPDGMSVFVVGEQATQLAEVLAPDASHWTPTGPMKTARQSPAAALLPDGRVIVAGGTDGSTAPLSTSEIWDPKTNAFTDGPTLKEAHGEGVTLVPLASGFLLGGGDGVTSLERLDAKATAWTDAGKLANPSVAGCVASIPGGALFAGGIRAGYTAQIYLGAAGGETCSTDDQCASGACTSGKCAATPPPDAGMPPAETGPSTDASPPPVSSGTPKVEGTFQRCTKDAECPTGHCSDGICCDTACTDVCHSCILPGHTGTCTASPIGVDLRGECGVALSCTGTCSGDGKCIGATAGSQCAPSKCTSTSTGVGPAVCAVAGARCPTSEVSTFDCAPYACEPIFGACRTTCAASSDCAGDNICDVTTKICVAPTTSDDGGGCSYGRPSPLRTGSGSALLLALTALTLRRSSRAL